MAGEVEHPALKTVICVPGPWADAREVVAAIASQSGGFLFAGRVMMDGRTRQVVELEVCGKDPNMRRAFAAAGPHWAKEKELQHIDSHRSVLYLVGPGGLPDRARSLMHFALGLLRAGGFAVKVESTGLAHAPQEWERMCDRKSELDLFRAFVVVVSEPGRAYSCGMHNLGYRDAIIEGDQRVKEVYLTIDTFLVYLLTEAPAIKDDQTFSRDADSPRYRMTRERCRTFPEDDLFHNPYGMWRLTPAE